MKSSGRGKSGLTLVPPDGGTHRVAPSDEVEVTVRAAFLPEQSQPESAVYVFGYQIRITNRGPLDVQLVSRHWQITDGHGHVEEVRGLGVVGEQPELAPGASYEYSSFCPLPTPTGSMEGSYLMVRSDGSQFLAPIPQFYLIEPNSLN